jgi:hypothetical protein
LSLLYPSTRSQQSSKHLWSLATKPALIVSDVVSRQLVLHGWAPSELREKLERNLDDASQTIASLRQQIAQRDYDLVQVRALLAPSEKNSNEMGALAMKRAEQLQAKTKELSDLKVEHDSLKGSLATITNVAVARGAEAGKISAWIATVWDEVLLLRERDAKRPQEPLPPAVQG